MSFAAPYLLLALVAVPVAAAAYVWLERQREARANQWVSPAMAPNLVHRPSPRRRHIPAALFLIGLTFLLVGFARPEARLSSTREGATVVLALDTSGSMAARDVKPTRILAARNAILTFLQELPPKYKVALVTFTDHPAVLQPPTYDRSKIVDALPLKATPSGTAIGDAVQRSLMVATQPSAPTARVFRTRRRRSCSSPTARRPHRIRSRSRWPPSMRSARTCRSRRSRSERRAAASSRS